MTPQFMMQVNGQNGYVINQLIRFTYYLLWKWFISLTLPMLIGAYLLFERALDLPEQGVVVLVLVVVAKYWYDTESLLYRVKELEEQVEQHYWDFHHEPNRTPE